MNKKDAIKLIDEKIADIKAAIAETKTNDKISKATRGTKLYALSRERRTVQLIRDLIAAGGDKVILPDDSLNTFTLLTTLSSERVVRVGLEAAIGDDILDIARKYPNKSLAKITQQLQTKGMDVDEKTGKVIELKK
jgi:hypothetical protein